MLTLCTWRLKPPQSPPPGPLWGVMLKKQQLQHFLPRHSQLTSLLSQASSPTHTKRLLYLQFQITLFEAQKHRGGTMLTWLLLEQWVKQADHRFCAAFTHTVGFVFKEAKMIPSLLRLEGKSALPAGMGIRMYRLGKESFVAMGILVLFAM